MILNLDLNPYIKKTYKVDEISAGQNIKSNFSNYTLGGSITIANLLNAFNENSFLTGFLGGLNGERYHQILLSNNLVHEFMQIKDETKLVLEIIDSRDNKISIVEEEIRVTREEVKKFLKLYLNLISNTQIICGTGDTLPLGVPSEIYYELIAIAKENRKKFILQAHGQELKKGIEANPYMVILNKQNLENLTNLDLQYENEIIKASNYILHRGVEFVVICLPNNDILLLGQEKGYRISSNIHDTINNFDLRKITAAFALGINRNYDLDMTSRLAYAFNAYEISEQASEEIEVSKIKKIMTGVEIYSINYV